MVSSGLLRRVALVRTDVSEEPGDYFIRMTKIGELETTQAAPSNLRMLLRKTSVLTTATRRNNPKDTVLHSHRRENLKSYIGTTLVVTSNRRTLRRNTKSERRFLQEPHGVTSQKTAFFIVTAMKHGNVSFLR
jgi:hypothetical protein